MSSREGQIARKMQGEVLWGILFKNLQDLIGERLPTYIEDFAKFFLGCALIWIRRGGRPIDKERLVLQARRVEKDLR